MLASLELLPMWSGVDSDVELFASGDVAEEDDEWAGGHSLDGSANAATDAGAIPHWTGSAAEPSALAA